MCAPADLKVAISMSQPTSEFISTMKSTWRVTKKCVKFGQPREGGRKARKAREARRTRRIRSAKRAKRTRRVRSVRRARKE